MIIRKATDKDRSEIIELYKKSQAFTGIPSTKYYPSEELGKKLYNRKAIERFVATEAGKIVGHGFIEEPNPDNIKDWMTGAKENRPLIELGGAFVHHYYSKQGIWTKLFEFRLNLIRSAYCSTPVSATWVENDHVKRTFEKFGGNEVAIKQVFGGQVSLYVFD